MTWFVHVSTCRSHIIEMEKSRGLKFGTYIPQQGRGCVYLEIRFSLSKIRLRLFSLNILAITTFLQLSPLFAILKLCSLRHSTELDTLSKIKYFPNA